MEQIRHGKRAEALKWVSIDAFIGKLTLEQRTQGREGVTHVEKVP